MTSDVKRSRRFSKREQRGEKTDDGSKNDETYEPWATMNEPRAGLASLLLGVDFLT